MGPIRAALAAIVCAILATSCASEGTGGAGGGGAGSAGGGSGGSGGAAGGTGGAAGGAGGAGGSASPCGPYCAAIDHLCEGDLQQYAGSASCAAFCALLPVGDPSDAIDNLQSLGCRRHHLDEAGADPMTHCGHAGPAGDGACGSPCGSYCLAMSAACPGAFVDDVACEAACAGWPPGGGYSVAAEADGGFPCHLVNALRALLDPVHCDDAGPASAACP